MNTSLARIAKCAAVAIMASTGIMHAAEHANFHLPVTAHWGLAVLVPGDYTMSLPVPSAGESSVRVAGDGRTVMAMPMTTDRQGTISKSSQLELWEVDGTYYVHQLSIGPDGRSFTFHVPKNGNHQPVARIVSANPIASE
jgi:hypothetical protein